jgi:Mg2+ and Co2+ transporter CorA
MPFVLRVLRLEGEAVRCGGRELAAPGSTIWIDCTPEPENLDWLATRFGFHPLALEDAAHADQRSKFEDYPGTDFIVLHRLAHLRRRIAPQREVLAALSRPGQQVVRERTVFYFRDVQDHVVRITEQLEVARDLASQTMEIYLSTVNNRLSSVMARFRRRGWF